jgi:hypothetical protein
MDSPFEAYHEFLCSIFGCWFFISVFDTFMLRKTKDPSVFYGHILSKIVEAFVINIDNIYVYYEGNHWNYRLIGAGVLFQITLIFINFHFLTKIPIPNGNLKERVNIIARLDFILLFSIGIFVFAFPDLVCLGLNEINESHRSITRGIGALIVSTSFQSLFVSEFKYTKDKKTFMLYRLITNLIKMTIVVVRNYFLQAFSQIGMWLYVLATSSYCLLVFYGYKATSLDNKSKTG